MCLERITAPFEHSVLVLVVPTYVSYASSYYQRDQGPRGKGTFATTCSNAVDVDSTLYDRHTSEVRNNGFSGCHSGLWWALCSRQKSFSKLLLEYWSKHLCTKVIKRSSTVARVIPVAVASWIQSHVAIRQCESCFSSSTARRRLHSDRCRAEACFSSWKRWKRSSFHLRWGKNRTSFLLWFLVTSAFFHAGICRFT